MGRIVIACYRPKAGQESALRELLRTHVSTLRSIDLVTDRRPVLMESTDGTFVEVFEWASPEAVTAAHGHPVVLGMWAEYAKVCDYVPIATVPEATQMFAEFSPVEPVP